MLGHIIQRQNVGHQSSYDTILLSIIISLGLENQRPKKNMKIWPNNVKK